MNKIAKHHLPREFDPNVDPYIWYYKTVKYKKKCGIIFLKKKKRGGDTIFNKCPKMLHDFFGHFTAAGCDRRRRRDVLGCVEEEVASMAFTLYSLIQTAILCTNAIAVLHEERFLSKSESWYNS